MSITAVESKQPMRRHWFSYLFEAVLAEALFVLLGEADWKSSGYNWSGTDFAVLKFLVH